MRLCVHNKLLVMAFGSLGLIHLLIIFMGGTPLIGRLNVSISDLTEFSSRLSYDLRLPSAVHQASLSQEDLARFTGIEPIDTAQVTDISFCRFEDERAKVWLKNSHAGVVFVPLSFKNSDVLSASAAYIFAEHPRLAILNFINEFWVNEDNELADHAGDVHPNAKIGRNVKIGRHCYIGANVELGDNTIIGNNTTINHAKIGQDCNIGCCVTIGNDGFGFEDENEEVLTFPHLGGVTIGDNVRVGSSTCIDRASLGNTIIEDHAKIDNLVHLAHNVVIGRAAKITAMTIIAGSTKIGKNAWVAPGATLRDWITIGENAFVGIGAVVTRNVESDKAVFGNPARAIQKPKSRYR